MSCCYDHFSFSIFLFSLSFADNENQCTNIIMQSEPTMYEIEYAITHFEWDWNWDRIEIERSNIQSDIIKEKWSAAIWSMHILEFDGTTQTPLTIRVAFSLLVAWWFHF